MQANNEVNDILNTLEYIRGLAAQGKREMAHMWNYISAFGFYIFLGSFSGALFGEWRMWVWALPVAFFLSTGPSLGWIKSFLTWVLVSAAVVFAASLVKNVVLIIAIVIVGAAIGISFLYRTLPQEMKRKKAFTVAPRLGIFWGILMGGTAFNVSCLATVKGVNTDVVQTLLWPFATGIGYLITGFFTAREFTVLGLLAIFGVPIVFLVTPSFTYVFFGLIGLAVGVIGIKLRLESKRRS